MRWDRMAEFEIYEDQNNPGEFRWRLRANNNEIIADSGERHGAGPNLAQGHDRRSGVTLDGPGSFYSLFTQLSRRRILRSSHITCSPKFNRRISLAHQGRSEPF